MTYCVAIKLNAGLVFLSDSRTGARPVPRIVGLACKGWEAEHRLPV